MKDRTATWVAIGAVVLISGCATPTAPPPPIPEIDHRRNNALVHEPQIVLERDLPGADRQVVEVVPEDLFVVYGMWSEGLPQGKSTEGTADTDGTGTHAEEDDR